MEVSLNTGFPDLPAAGGIRKPAETPPRVQDDVEIGQAAALERALARTPDVRPDVVARGEQLVADRQYPPPEIIRRIASLLALNATSSESSD